MHLKFLVGIKLRVLSKWHRHAAWLLQVSFEAMAHPIRLVSDYFAIIAPRLDIAGQINAS